MLKSIFVLSALLTAAGAFAADPGGYASPVDAARALSSCQSTPYIERLPGGSWAPRCRVA